MINGAAREKTCDPERAVSKGLGVPSVQGVSDEWLVYEDEAQLGKDVPAPWYSLMIAC